MKLTIKEIYNRADKCIQPRGRFVVYSLKYPCKYQTPPPTTSEPQTQQNSRYYDSYDNLAFRSYLHNSTLEVGSILTYQVR